MLLMEAFLDFDDFEDIEQCEEIDPTDFPDIPHAFPKKELKAVHDRLKAEDESALVAWGAYFLVMARLSAGKAVAELRDGEWYPEIHDELSSVGMKAAMKEAEKLMKRPEFVMYEPENYTWRAIKNAITGFLKWNNRYAKNHKSIPYTAVKGEVTGLEPEENEPNYKLDWERLSNNCEDPNENEVIQRLKENRGNEKAVAKIVGRSIEFVRSVRYLVEERTLRRTRTVFKINRPESIEPVSQESVPREKGELEEVHAACKTALDRAIIDLFMEHGDIDKVAEIMECPKEHIKNRCGVVLENLAKRKRDQGEPSPVLEKRAKTLKASRPRRKQSNDWAKDKPSQSKRNRQPVNK